MSVCNPLLLTKFHPELLLPTANKNNKSSNKIWNPAFTESVHERKPKELIPFVDPRLNFLAQAAAMRGLLPGLSYQSKFPSHQVSDL